MSKKETEKLEAQVEAELQIIPELGDTWEPGGGEVETEENEEENTGDEEEEGTEGSAEEDTDPAAYAIHLEDVSPNIALLTFPSDRFGFCTPLKKGARQTLLRLSDDPEKFDIFMGTLQKIASYGRALYLEKCKEKTREEDSRLPEQVL